MLCYRVDICRFYSKTVKRKIPCLGEKGVQRQRAFPWRGQRSSLLVAPRVISEVSDRGSEKADVEEIRLFPTSDTHPIVVEVGHGGNSAISFIKSAPFLSKLGVGIRLSEALP